MRPVIAVAAAFSLAACSGLPGLDAVGVGGGANYAAASSLGAGLAGRDLAALAPVFEQAVENGKPGERYDWRGPAASGWVRAGDRLVGELKADAGDRPPLDPGIDIAGTFDTELGLYAVSRTANVRIGPGTEHATRGQLEAGAPVIVVGRLVGAPWMLVESKGRVVGYVHESLLVRQPGSEFTLAGGPRRKAQLCRAYEQRLVVGSQSDVFSGVACRDGRDWRLAPPADDAASWREPAALM
jgi:hypothetical protein